MNILDLLPKIEDRSAQIGVIGLGYVGLSVACMVAQQGFHVQAVDIDEQRVDSINRGKLPIGGEEPDMSDLVATVTAGGLLRASTEYETLKNVDMVVVCVDT